MNRHARRAAKARGLTSDPGFLRRGLSGLANTPPGVTLMTVLHDSTCPRAKPWSRPGRRCTCTPDIYRSTGDTFEVIDPDGRVTVTRQN
jgi:hypothetical protein